MDISVGNSTDAMKGRQLLRQHGIHAYVTKHSGRDGCSYVIRIPARNESIGADILRKNHII